MSDSDDDKPLGYYVVGARSAAVKSEDDDSDDDKPLGARSAAVKSEDDDSDDHKPLGTLAKSGGAAGSKRKDAGEGPARKKNKRDAVYKSGDLMSYTNRRAVVQDDHRLKEIQTLDGGQKKANAWRDLGPSDERYGKIWDDPEHFAWEGPKEKGKADKKRSIKIDRHDGKGVVYLFPKPEAKAPDGKLASEEQDHSESHTQVNSTAEMPVSPHLSHEQNKAVAAAIETLPERSMAVDATVTATLANETIGDGVTEGACAGRMTTDETIDPSGVAKGWGTGSAGGSASTPALSAALGAEDGVQPLRVGVEQGGTGNAATEEGDAGAGGEAGREGGGHGPFESQHLACVLNAAMSTKTAMWDFATRAKSQFNDVFKGVTKQHTVEGKVVKHDTKQIAESIASCRPDAGMDAEGLFRWLVEKKLLKNSHLQAAMGELKPAIKYTTRDTTEMLISKIVGEMRKREVAASAEDESSEGAGGKRGPDDSAGAAQGEKKSKIGGEGPAAPPDMGVSVEQLPAEGGGRGGDGGKGGKRGPDDSAGAVQPEKKSKTGGEEGGGEDASASEHVSGDSILLSVDDTLRGLTEYILSEAADPKEASLDLVQEKLAKSIRMIDPNASILSEDDLEGRRQKIEEWRMHYAEKLGEVDEGNPDEDSDGDGEDDDVNFKLDSSAPKVDEEEVPLPKARHDDPPEMQMGTSTCVCGEHHSGTHQAQCKVAKRLFEKMKDGSFADFELFMLVPNLNSLYNQTVKRLEKFIRDVRQRDVQYGAFLASRDAAGRVFKAGLSDANKTIYSEMVRRIEEEKDTLFLLIHDEAHYEATRGDKETAVDAFINSKMVLSSRNVFTLLVSATPYNLVSSNSRIPDLNIIDWMNDGLEQEKSEYFGLAKYVERSALPLNLIKSGYLAADDDFEARVGKKAKALNAGKKVKALETDQVRFDMIVSDYKLALQLCCKKGQPAADHDNQCSEHTRKMVADLLNVQNGKGCMILVRTTNIEFGKTMAKDLRICRRDLGLAQKFAIIVDVEAKKRGMAELLKKDFISSSGASEDRGWVNRLRLLHGKLEKDKDFPQSYEDLNDLPCILILCEKGKMGDTFPKSLRYYDLRMRYANSCEFRAPVEQDLGRAFRYGPETLEYPFPVVLVGKKCHTQLVGGGRLRSQKEIFRLSPDGQEKMSPIGKKTLPNSEEEALSVYRKHWKANEKHYDFKNETENERRFLLVGRPQIGKTGAFLHLVYLLWKKHGNRKVELPPAVDVESPDRGDSDPEPDPDPITREERHKNMGLYPDFEFMKDTKFYDKPCAGKYGDPTSKSLIEWYLHGECPADCMQSDHKHFQKTIHAHAKEGSTAAAAFVVNKSATGTKSAGKSDSASGARSAADANARAELPPAELEKSHFAHARCTHGNRIQEYKSFEISFTDTTGTLHVPIGLPDQHGWWDVNGANIRLKDRGVEEKCISMPIFMPSRGRARCKLHTSREGSRCNCGYLDLAKTMVTSGEGGQGKVGESWKYIQILIVIQEEVEDYKKYGPEDAVIFALPAEASKYGIGFSRHFAKKLAEQICPPSFRFCLMMDDSVQYWKGITLPKDPQKPFCKDALFGEEAKAVRSDISLADTLLHFIKGLRDDSRKVKDFAIIGFHRLNGWESSQRAFTRTHCTSTVILNLDKLRDVHYLKRAYVWEDLQFNRDAEKKGLVICKCYRFAFYTPQLREGGCAEMVARPDDASGPAAEPQLSNSSTIIEPQLDDSSSAQPEDELRELLRGLKTPDGNNLNEERVESYVTTLNDAELTLDDLKTTFNDKMGKGKDDVTNALKDAGVGPPGMVTKLANAISQLCQQTNS